MKTNMDIFAASSNGVLTFLDEKDSFIQSVLSNPIQRQSDIQRYVKGMFIALINWINGANVHQTLLSNVFLTNHSKILNPILSNFAKLIGHTSLVILQSAIATGVLNEEDLSSDAIQQKLLFGFQSELEFDRFLSQAKGTIKNDSQLLTAFDALELLNCLIRSSNGDAINCLDAVKHFLHNLSTCWHQLVSFLAFQLIDNNQPVEFGFLPYVEAGITIFPPRKPCVFFKDNLLEFFLLHCIPRLDRFLSLFETLDGVQLALFFANLRLDLHNDIIMRICIVNWLKKLYEIHWTSYPSLFSFPFEMDADSLRTFILWCLFQCRNCSWIFRKTPEFVSKIIAPTVTIGQASNRFKNEFFNFLLNESYLKQISTGIQLNLYSHNELVVMQKIMLAGIIQQQSYWSQVSVFQSDMEQRKNDLVRQIEQTQSISTLSPTEKQSLRRSLEHRLKGTFIENKWRVAIDDILSKC